MCVCVCVCMYIYICPLHGRYIITMFWRSFNRGKNSWNATWRVIFFIGCPIYSRDFKRKQTLKIIQLSVMFYGNVPSNLNRRRLSQRELAQDYTTQLQVFHHNLLCTVKSNQTAHPVDHIVIYYIYSFEANFSQQTTVLLLSAQLRSPHQSNLTFWRRTFFSNFSTPCI